jgi:hypothetical protein
MPKAIIKGLPMISSEGDMKKLRAGTRKLVRASKGKLVEFTVVDDVVTIDVDNTSALEVLCEQLRKFGGVSLTVVQDDIEELLLQYEEASKKAK